MLWAMAPQMMTVDRNSVRATISARSRIMTVAPDLLGGYQHPKARPAAHNMALMKTMVRPMSLVRWLVMSVSRHLTPGEQK